MNSKRIFIGSFIRLEKLNQSFDKIKQIFDKDNKISWTRTVDNFHITFHFLGQTSLDNINIIQNFLNKNYKEIQKIETEIKGLDFFKRKGKPSIIYAEIQNNEELNRIFEKLDNFLFEQGIIEKKNVKFKPHITLGRIKKASVSFYNDIEKFKDINFGKQNGIKIEVIESILHPKGALYKPLKL